MPTGSDRTPRWSLDSVYPGLQSAQFEGDVERLEAAIDAARTVIRDEVVRTDAQGWLSAALAAVNRMADLFVNLEAYCYTQYSVATSDEAAAAALNRISAYGVPIREIEVLFREALGTIGTHLDTLCASDPELAQYRYYIEEQLFYRSRQLSAAEERLAADLNRAGGEAWSRLQESVSSALSAPWSADERKTVVQLRALAFDPSRDVRRKAYTLELEAWRSVEIPLSFAINGVKGFTDILNTRRGWPSTLDRSTRQSRLSTAAREALISTMESALPLFRRYLRAKAVALGLPKLAFYDIFAPLAAGDEQQAEEWSFGAARDYIVTQFTGFSADLGEFAQTVFDQGWIDAEPRAGKVGGAYCIDFPVARESRILANFNGSFHDVSTLAHELGHAYHSHLMRDLAALQRDYPMTLAETASIFCETLIFNRRLSTLQGEQRTAVLEGFLQESTQVIVDILSRFYFESAVMQRRVNGELSARELCELMIDAQKRTYGDALDERELHPYMWAVKGHYYRPELAFYNYPYAFGQLFGIGLYAQYLETADSFPSRYRDLLRSTGVKSAVDVARSTGFDIEQPAFWQSAVDVIAGYVEEFETLTSAR